MPSMLRAGIAALGVAVACAAAAQSRERLDDLASELRAEPFELFADAIEVDLERDLYVARGHVEIRQRARTLRADWAAFNRRTGAGVASGDVELLEGGEWLHAEFVEFDLDDLQGVIYGGRFESSSTPFRGSGAEIAKTGERSYRFRDGTFTTCRCPDPQATDPWTIRAGEADLEVEGYGTVRNATFDVLGVPLVWFPWMILPLKTERQSGFLFPELSLSSFSGFRVGLPFFWALHEQAGLILTPRYSAKRGFGGAGHFDYVLGRESEGEMVAAYTRDRDISPHTPSEPFGRDRWSTRGTHDLHGPAGLRFLTDYRFASDNRVPLDFPELERERTNRFLESRASVTRHFGELGRVGAGVGATFADDLQNPDDLDRDRFLLQRWPAAQGVVLPGELAGLGWLVPSLDVDYAWFQARERAGSALPAALPGPRGLFLDTGIDALPDGREPGAGPDPHLDDASTRPGGTEGDGVFEEGEPLTDEGHRLVLNPRLAVPLRWRGLRVLPEFGWHETLYDTRIRDFRERGFPTARVDVSTRLEGRLGSWVHVLEPLVGYAFARTPSQEREPLFVPATAAPQERIRALDLDLVTRDSADRIERANRVSFGFGNRLFGGRGAEGFGRLLADVSLLGLYDFERDRLSSVLVDGRARPRPDADLRFHADLDPERARFDEVQGDLAWSPLDALRLSGGYRYVRRAPLFFESFLLSDRFQDGEDRDHIEQVRAGVGLDLTQQWSVRYQLFYSIAGRLTLGNQGTVEYLSRCRCWSLGVEISQDRARGVDAKLVYRLVGLGGEPARRGGGLLDDLGALW